MIIRIDRFHIARSDLRRIISPISQSRPVVLPTETQYALACDATSKDAIAAVRTIKGRKPSAPFSVFLPHLDDLARWRIGCPNYAEQLARAFWPGPMTLVLPTTNPIFKLLGGNGKSVGVRVTPEPVIAMLLELLQAPLVATSANPSGTVMDARTENRWLESLVEARMLVWARPFRYVRKPASTIIDCTGRVPRELRSGPITKAVWNEALSIRVQEYQHGA